MSPPLHWSGVTRTTVVLVRHGETDWNRAGRIQGWAPVSLNERGRTQARKLGTALQRRYDVDALVASDLCRARETAALLVESGIDVDSTFERGWRERDVGIYQGMDRETLDRRFPAFVPDHVAAVRERPDGGERLLDVHERVLVAWERLTDRLDDETAVVVTHGGPIRLLLGALTGQDIPTAVTERSPKNCAITEVRVGETVEIVRENEHID